MTTATTAPTAEPEEKFRKDYKVPDYSIQTVDLTFKIFKGHTQVEMVLCFEYFAFNLTVRILGPVLAESEA